LDDPLRSAIHEYKYRGARELATPLAGLMLDCWHRNHLSADGLVPVALHRRRRRERGYNQATLLARELAQGLPCPMMEDVLHRDRPTLPQVGLNSHQRKENVAGAFSCAEGAVEGLRIMLIDDVCTSGATLEACASTLRAQGRAQSVRALTVARARGLDDRITSAPH
jgi:ComF family protein